MRLVTFCHFIMTAILTSACWAKGKESDSEKPDAKASSVNARKSAVFQKKHAYPSKRRMSLKRKLKAEGFEETKIPQYEIPPFLTREDLNKIIPKDVTAQNSKDEVLRKMSDKAVQVWLKSPTMQNMAVVQTAQKVENAMKAEVALGSPEDEGVKHKLNFQVQAFQTTSKIDYTGYVNASLSYNMREHKTGVEVREKVFKNKDLYVNHSATKSENLSSVGMKWSF